MMHELTPGAERALAAAVAWAKRQASGELLPVHVLLGLFDEEEGHPVALLTQQQVDLARARDALLNTLPPPTPGHPFSEVPYEHGFVRQLLPAARHVAIDLGEKTPNTIHLLLAVLELEAPLEGLLASIGFNANLVRASLEEAQGPPLVLDEPLELLSISAEMEAGRILDANANRAREALRVLEEHARFVQNDEYLTGLLKSVRHDLAEALEKLPSELLLAARTTEADVGTRLSTPSEGHRPSLAAVVTANAKRLAEALRSLEEYGKVLSPEFGQAIEQLRYRTYILEQALHVGSRARARLANCRLYLLLGRSTSAASLEWTIAEAAAGGVDIVQLREKGLADKDWLELARRARVATRKAGVLFIMNDRPDLARLADADGVHLGQDDLSVAEARRIVGPDALIGVSTHAIEQAEAALRAGASYLGVGPTFVSQTKAFPSFPGLDYVGAVAKLTTLPAFAIGGITPKNVASVVKAGATRIAVGQAISMAEDPQAVARLLRSALGSSRTEGADRTE